MSPLLLPARHRLAVAVTLAVATAAVREITPALLALGVGLVLTVAARPPAGLLLKAFLRLNAFFLLIFFTLPLGFGVPQGPAFDLGFAHFSLRGAVIALVMLLKANAVALMFIALPGRCSAHENCRALKSLGAPDKLVTLLLLMAGHIGLFARELEALKQATKLRGFVPRFSLHTLRTSANLAAMLLIRAHDKSKRMDEAMRLRGFSGRFALGADTAAATPAALALTLAGLAAALAILAAGLYLGPS